MDVKFVVALALGCLASMSMNLGKGIQKMKVVVWKTWPRVLAPENRKDFLIWCVGMSLTAVAGILFTEALNKTDKSSIIASLNGIGLIALAIFSFFVLKERVGIREWGAILLIVCGTALVQYFNVPSSEKQTFNLTALLVCLGVSVAVFAILALATRLLGRGRAFIFALIAGTFLALMVIFFDIAGTVGGEGFVGKFLTVYFLVGFFCGNGAFVFTNLAFFHGSATMIVPTVNSFMILMPIIYEYFVFGATMKPVQYAGVGVIVAGVVILTTGQGHRPDSEPASR